MRKSSSFHISLIVKICIAIIVISLSVTGLVSVLNYHKYLDAVYDVHTDYARKMGSAIDGYLTEDQWKLYVNAVLDYQHDELSDDEIENMAEEEAYQKVLAKVQDTVENMGLISASVFTVDQEAMNAVSKENFDPDESYFLYFLMDCYSSASGDQALEFGSASCWWDNYEDFEMYRDIFQYVISEKEDYPVTENLEEGGVYISDYIPILCGDEVTAIVMISGDAIKINDFMHSFFLDSLRTGILVAVILIILAVAYFYICMVRPLGIIKREAEAFVQNNAEVSAELNKIRTHDEIQDVANSVLKMEQEIQDYIRQVEEVTEENARISTELNVATKIQMDMLPTVFPPFPKRKEFDIYATMDPAKEVGGDFYDFFFVDEDHLALIIADVAGKGVPAALFMAIAKSLIKNRAQMGGTPSEILSDVNNQLCDGNEEGMFVTVWMAIVNLATGEVTEANAGHEHPVKRENEFDDEQYKLICYRHSLALAAMNDIPIREQKFTLKPGDRIFVYTDGLPEAINASDEAYGTDRLVDILNRGKKMTLEETLQMVTKDVEEFVGDMTQFDDMTMLIFEYKGE